MEKQLEEKIAENKKESGEYLVRVQEEHAALVWYCIEAILT